MTLKEFIRRVGNYRSVMKNTDRYFYALYKCNKDGSDFCVASCGLNLAGARTALNEILRHPLAISLGKDKVVFRGSDNERYCGIMSPQDVEAWLRFGIKPELCIPKQDS